MKRIFKLEYMVAFFAVLIAAPLAAVAQAKPAPNTILSRFAEAGGVKFHYLTAGEGPVVILLHGYAQTSRMWRPLIPKLTEKFRVLHRTCRESAIPIFPKMVWT